MNYLPYALVLLFVGTLWRMYTSQYRRVLDSRARLLDDCRALLTRPMLKRSAAGFATLSGELQGLRVTMQLEADHLAMRKIPTLWLHVTLEDDEPMTRGMLDILVRPQNIETYSPSWDWDTAVQPLPGWPTHARYASKTAPPDLKTIDREVVRLFSDEHVKELVITPRRLRVTFLAKQAERGEYLLLRAIHFDPHPIPAATVAALIEQLLGIRQQLKVSEHDLH